MPPITEKHANLYMYSLVPIVVFQCAVLALDDSVLDVDQVENLIKFSPTKEEMEMLKVSCPFLVSFTRTLRHKRNISNFDAIYVYLSYSLTLYAEL